jgi:hypothetical protein
LLKRIPPYKRRVYTGNRMSERSFLATWNCWLFRIISGHKDLLKSDVWLICDGPVHQSRAAQIVFGARGVVTANPAMMLAQLLASMKNEDGRVLIENFYDGVTPLSPSEKQALAEMPAFDEQLKSEFWLGRTEGDGGTLRGLSRYRH